MRRRLLAELSGQSAPAPPAGEQPNRAIICGKWGEQLLSVPIAGGRRKLQKLPAEQLMLSEHGNWRHTHWQAITSAYGAYPFFQYLSDDFAAIYARPAGSFAALCSALDEAFDKAINLEANLTYLKETPRSLPLPADASLFPSHRAAIELLFARGPQAIFYLLGQ